MTVEFRSGKPDSKTLSGLNKEHVTVFRVQDSSEKGLMTKAFEKVLGGSAIGQSEKFTSVVHVYPTGSSFESMETNEVSNVVKHEKLHQAGESFISDYTAKENGNVMDPNSYESQLEDKDLQINVDQGKELTDKFNGPNEVDSNPDGATCVGGCPATKRKNKPK